MKKYLVYGVDKSAIISATVSSVLIAPTLWPAHNDCTSGTPCALPASRTSFFSSFRSEEHTSEFQSRFDLVWRLLIEQKKSNPYPHHLPATHRSYGSRQ